MGKKGEKKSRVYAVRAQCTVSVKGNKKNLKNERKNKNKNRNEERRERKKRK